MASNTKPLIAIVCIVALLAWIGAIMPGTTQQATAKPSLKTPRLNAQFVALHDGDHDDEDEEDYDDHDDHDDHDEEGHEEEEDWDDEDWEEESRQLEMEYEIMELRRVELQTLFGEMELVQEVANIAESPERTAMLVILTAMEEIEESEAEMFLLDLLSRATSDSVKRLIRMELAQVYSNMDQNQKALDQIRVLVSGS